MLVPKRGDKHAGATDEGERVKRKEAKGGVQGQGGRGPAWSGRPRKASEQVALKLRPPRLLV